MGDDTSSRWAEGSAIEIKGTMDLGACGQFRIDAGATEEVECELGVGHELIPKM